jgi:hypothetical protein
VFLEHTTTPPGSMPPFFDTMKLGPVNRVQVLCKSSSITAQHRILVKASVEGSGGNQKETMH